MGKWTNALLILFYPKVLKFSQKEKPSEKSELHVLTISIFLIFLCLKIHLVKKKGNH